MIVWIHCFRLQGQPIFINGSLQPFFESNAIFNYMPNVPMVWAIKRLVNHSHLLRPSGIRQIQKVLLIHLFEEIFDESPTKYILFIEDLSDVRAPN